MKNKVLALTAVSAVAVSNASAAMTADPSSGLTAIEGYADSALLVAITIGGLVIGWGYVKRLIKKG